MDNPKEEKEKEMQEENDFKNYPEDNSEEVKIYKEIKDREFYLGIAGALIMFILGVTIGVILV